MSVQKDSMLGGADFLTGWMERLDDDPGKSLAHITWLGLAIAQQAQAMAEHVVSEAGTDAVFYSLQGALFNAHGQALTYEREHFTILKGGSRDEW